MGIQTLHVPDNLTLEELETIYVRHVVSLCDGNKAEMARRLGLTRYSLYRLLERLDRAAKTVRQAA
jgi:DNA-binding NtrC family response regulator